MNNLILSLFPGLDLFGMAFEMEGFCVVRGPDIIFGRDIRNFHPPAAVFGGVIGGPPCQRFSSASFFNALTQRNPDLIPEFVRCVSEARPAWWLMENVLLAPDPELAGYYVQKLKLEARLFQVRQNRKRAFWFGCQEDRPIQIQMQWPIPERVESCVTASEAKRGSRNIVDKNGRKRWDKTRPLSERLKLMGLAEDFSIPGFLQALIGQLIGNGVPIPMGRALARAVRETMEKS